MATPQETPEQAIERRLTRLEAGARLTSSHVPLTDAEVATLLQQVEPGWIAEPPDPAEPTDEMITSLETALLAEWYGCTFEQAAGGISSSVHVTKLVRRLACRAFEHAPYLVPDRPGSQPTQGWRPIATIAECKTADVALVKEAFDRGGWDATITNSERAMLRASRYGWKYWQPIELPSWPQ